MKIYSHLVIFITAIYNGIIYGYNESDKDQFTKTKSCVKCDLSKKDFNGGDRYDYSLLDEADLTNCKFYFANFDNSSFNGAYLIKASASSSSYMPTSFRQASFIGAALNNTSFIYADFSNANFQNTNLKYANFKNANLSGANFAGAAIDGIILENSILIGSNLSEEQLAKAKSLRCAVLPNGTISKPNDNGECYF